VFVTTLDLNIVKNLVSWSYCMQYDRFLVWNCHPSVHLWRCVLWRSWSA